jgi:RimJ/RimL family protein N-acetyltransferase
MAATHDRPYLRSPVMIETPRVLLRRWRDSDAGAFAAMNADAEVMADLGGPIDRTASDAKLSRFQKAFERLGLTRWLIEDRATGLFLGYAGIDHHANHPLGAHYDIGWRLTRGAWGKGYATEAAAAALADAFTRVGLTEVFAYSAPDNLRSQAVMARLGLERAPARDFTLDYGKGPWLGFVWIARR